MSKPLKDWKYEDNRELGKTILHSVPGSPDGLRMEWDQAREFEFFDRVTKKTVKRVLIPLLLDVDADCPLGRVIEANVEEGWVIQWVEEAGMSVQRKTTGLRLKLVFDEETLP